MSSRKKTVTSPSGSFRPASALLAVLAILPLGGCASWDKPVPSVETPLAPELLGAKDIDPAMRERIARAIGLEIDEGALRDALQRESGNVDAAIGLTRALLARKRPHEALEVLDKLLVAVPGDVRALNAKGVILDTEGRHDEAQALYRQALGAAPRNQMLRNNLNLSLALDGRADTANAILQPLPHEPHGSARSR